LALSLIFTPFLVSNTRDPKSFCQTMTEIEYSEEEKSALRGIFDLHDKNNSGTIPSSQLSTILEKIGRNSDEANDMLLLVDAETEGTITFQEFLSMLRKKDSETAALGEGPDPKVVEFLHILDEYRVKCEDEGNYLEAGRATKQLDTLKKQEGKRQEKALRARQLAERQDVQIAHNMQYAEFNSAWDKYLEEYDQMAQMYIQQMTERHATTLREFQEDLHRQLLKRPAKYSKELLDWRRRQNMLARQKNYAEAQKIKRIADVMEERERKSIDTENRKIFSRKESQLRKQQQSELQALLKRIEGRRREHIKQRNLDSKRLLQRNRNVQAVLEAKQSLESKKTNDSIKATLSMEGRSKRRSEQREPIAPQPKARRRKKRPQNEPLSVGGTENTFLTQ
jgi:hypothetical protein